MASYPFDDSALHTASDMYSLSPDDSLFRYLAQVYAKNHPIMKTGKPKCAGEPDETFKDGITNGAKWYDVAGNFYLTIQLVKKNLGLATNLAKPLIWNFFP